MALLFTKMSIGGMFVEKSYIRTIVSSMDDEPSAFGTYTATTSANSPTESSHIPIAILAAVGAR